MSERTVNVLNEKTNSAVLSRRRFIVGMGVAAGALTVGCGESSQALTANTTSLPRQEGAQVTDQDADIAAVSNEQTNFSVREIALSPNPNTYAEEIRALAEDSPQSIEKRFNMSTDSIESAEDFPEMFASHFGEALYAGCTFADVEPYIALGEDAITQAAATDNYLAEMDHKYTFPIFQGMFESTAYRESGVRFTYQEALNNSTFQALQKARHAVLKRFINRVRQKGDMKEAVYVAVFDHNFENHGTDNRGDGIYSGEIYLVITNQGEHYDSTQDYYVADGLVGVRAESDKETGLFRTFINHQPEYQEVFNELEASALQR